MQVVRVFLSIILTLSQAIVFVPTVKADDAMLASSGVVISQMYPGDDSSPKQEFVEIYNNSDTTVDVTGWCVKLLFYTGTTARKICLTTTDFDTALLLDPGTYSVFMSNDLRDAVLSDADGYFTGNGLSANGYVVLLDSDKSDANEIDRLGWGILSDKMYSAKSTPENGKALQRKTANFRLQDTDDNSIDFVDADPLLHGASIYEDTVTTDVCSNMVDKQVTIPDGYLVDENGDCQPDSCLNLVDLQLSVPNGYDSDGAGVCARHDECDNVDGIQTNVPAGMVRAGVNDCRWNVLQITLTELYPNAIGSDTGNEFIEIYNPTNTMIDLSLYTIRVGAYLEKTFTFPIGATIAPGEYQSFDNNTIKFTLVNSTSRVQLVGLDNVVYGDSASYENPNEGESWAFINGTWQYTNRPTPGEVNLPSIIEEASTVSGVSASCPAGKYRNPLTNRCRNIVSDAVVLGDCGDGKYRNPETNRCKSIASETELAACKTGQYRSPETNRCRNIVSTASATLKPCKENQYRSEETNRCRNSLVAAVPSAAYKVQPVKDSGSTFVGWLALGSVGLIAIGYGAWEWRQEILRILQKSFGRFHKS